MNLKICYLLLFFLTTTFGSNATTIFYQPSPKVNFGVKELSKVLLASKVNLKKSELANFNTTFKASDIIILQKSDKNLLQKLSIRGIDSKLNIEPEGFSLQKTNENTYVIIADDEAGAMYGLLELAEQIKINGVSGVRNTHQNPYMKERGVKFNIPLDVRTPSYTDVCDAAQQNIATMWDYKFWTDYIDDLAKNRYNLISLWNLHPFPSMVKVPEYPDVALNDVQRSTVKWNEFYSLSGSNFCQPDIINNVEVLKKMTIDEKIAFWRKVMKYGKDRNVHFFIVTWNVFVCGAEGKYGITDDYKNQTTVDYFRKSVKQLILTYPDLKGIGLTTGENFQKANTQEKEDWAFNTFGQGVLDACTLQPKRKITFIHRQHQTGALAIANKFKPLIDNPNINFIFSFKYAQAHVFSSTKQPFCNDFVKEIKTKGNLKTLWTLRNDDNYYFRWGAPDFVREFITNIPHEVSEGFYFGSDQWIWGREFLSKDSLNSGELENDKHWYHWMMWGRLGYNPALKNDFFEQKLSERFSGVEAEKLFSAWQSASMIYPVTTGFHWGDMDFRWYIEGCKSLPRASMHEYGFHCVNKFIELAPHPGKKNQSITNYVNMLVAGEKTDSISPLQVSQSLHQYADNALEALKYLKSGNNTELDYTLKDIETMAYLGKYYAYKIAGATELQKYRILRSNRPEYQQNAVYYLTKASEYWRRYAGLANQSYKNPLWTNRVGYVNFNQIYQWTLDDIKIAEKGN